MLERFGFSGDQQWTPIGELSGGERRRLQLLRLLMDEPNVLLLDEPTNDLDIETLTELEDLLDGWPGSMTVVSHDRYFLERITDHVVALLGDGKLSFLPGGVEQYLERVRGTREASLPMLAGAPVANRFRYREVAARIWPRNGRPARNCSGWSGRSSGSPSREAAAGRGDGRTTPADYEQLTKLGADLRSVQADKADLEERWLAVAGELDG